MTKRMRERSQRGFTIFELIVVLAILGILAGVLYPKLQNREVAAKLQATEMDMLRIYESCEAWKANRGQPNFTGLTYDELNKAGLWNTGKLNPWGAEYSIALDSTGGTNINVKVYSGDISDETILDALESRFKNKNYHTEISGNQVLFRAPN